VIENDRKGTIRRTVLRCWENIRLWICYIAESIEELLPYIPGASFRDRKQGMVVILSAFMNTLCDDGQMERRILSDRMLFSVSLTLWFVQDPDNYDVPRHFSEVAQHIVVNDTLQIFQRYHKTDDICDEIINKLFPTDAAIDALVDRVLAPMRAVCKAPLSFDIRDAVYHAFTLASLALQPRVLKALAEHRVGKLVGKAYKVYTELINYEWPMAQIDDPAERKRLVRCVLLHSSTFFTALYRGQDVHPHLRDGLRQGLLGGIARLSYNLTEWLPWTGEICGALSTFTFLVLDLFMKYSVNPTTLKLLVRAFDDIKGQLPVLMNDGLYGKYWAMLYRTTLERVICAELVSTAYLTVERTCDNVCNPLPSCSRECTLTCSHSSVPNLPS
jgi:hypothetical protein